MGDQQRSLMNILMNSLGPFGGQRTNQNPTIESMMSGENTMTPEENLFVQSGGNAHEAEIRNSSQRIFSSMMQMQRATGANFQDLLSAGLNSYNDNNSFMHDLQLDGAHSRKKVHVKKLNKPNFFRRSVAKFEDYMKSSISDVTTSKGWWARFIFGQRLLILEYELKNFDGFLVTSCDHHLEDPDYPPPRVGPKKKNKYHIQ